MGLFLMIKNEIPVSQNIVWDPMVSEAIMGGTPPATPNCIFQRELIKENGVFGRAAWPEKPFPPRGTLYLKEGSAGGRPGSHVPFLMVKRIYMLGR